MNGACALLAQILMNKNIMNNYKAYIKRKELEYGDKFDPSNLPSHLVPYYESNARIEIKTSYGEIKRGRVGVTTGWRPSFLLMPRIDSRGSSELLDHSTQVIKVISS